MKEKIEAIRATYTAFYDLPAKTPEMFDAMDAAARVIRLKDTVGSGLVDAVASELYDRFAARAKTPAQKEAIDTLLLLTM